MDNKNIQDVQQFELKTGDRSVSVPAKPLKSKDSVRIVKAICNCVFVYIVAEGVNKIAKSVCDCISNKKPQKKLKIK